MPTLSVAAHEAVNLPSTERTTVMEVLSEVMVGTTASTDTRPYRQVDQLPAASEARTAIVQLPVVKVRPWVRDVVDWIADHAPVPRRARTW